MRKWGPKANPDPLGDPMFWLLILGVIFSVCWVVIMEVKAFG